MDPIDADIFGVLNVIGAHARVTWSRLIVAIAANECRRANALAERLAACVRMLRSIVAELSADLDCDTSYKLGDQPITTELRLIERTERFIQKSYPKNEWDEMARAFSDLNDTFPKMFDHLLPEVLAVLQGDTALRHSKAAILTEFGRELDHLTYHLETDFVERSRYSAEWNADDEP